MKITENKTYDSNFFIISIILIGLSARLIYLWQISEYPNFSIPYAGLDAALYHDLAKQVAGGNLILGREVYYYPPFYAYFLGVFYYLFGDSYWTARILNIALGTATIFIIYLYSTKLFQKKSIALIASFGAAVYGPFIVFDTSMLKETLLRTILSLSVLLIAIASEKGEKRQWFFAGLLLGIAVSISGQTSLFIVFICCWLLFKKHSDKTITIKYWKLGSLPLRLTMISSFLAGIILIVAPFTIRNYYVSKDMVLTTSTNGLHFYIGNHKGASGEYSKIEGIRPNPAGHFFDARQIAEKATGRPLSASEVSDYWQNKALDFIFIDTGEFLLLLKEKIRLFFNFYEIPNNDNYKYLTSISPYLSVFPGIGFLMTLGLSGLFLSFFESRKPVPLQLFFFSYMTAVILTLVTWRYRMPITLVLLPMTGLLIVRFWNWIKEKRFSYLTLCLFFLLFFYMLGNAPAVKRVHHEKDIKKAANKMEACKQEGLILNEIASGMAESGYNKSLLVQKLARLRYRQYDTEGAVKILRQALAEDPEQPELLNDLAFMLFKLGEFSSTEEAKKNFLLNPVGKPVLPE